LATAADVPCSLRFAPPDVAGEWRRAGVELAKRMSGWPKPDRDCRELVIQPSGAGAVLTIVTGDGRRASRPVDSPDALIAVASALAVSIASTPEVETPQPPESASPPSPPAEPSGWFAGTPVVGALGGARVAAPGAWLAPVARVSAGLEVGSFEFGLFNEWQYWVAAGEAPPAFHAWAMRAGAAVGVSQAIGQVDLLGGLTFGASFIEERAEKRDLKDGVLEIDDEHETAVEPDLGAYLGIRTGHGRGLRFRAQIEVDLPANRIGSTRELDSDLPKLPALRFGLVVGMAYAMR
jgi:hypothetical protein